MRQGGVRALRTVPVACASGTRDDRDAEHDDPDDFDGVLGDVHRDESPAHAADQNDPSDKINDQGHRFLLG
jgi:hypothetical protein